MAQIINQKKATFEMANILRSLLTPELTTTIQKYTNFKEFRQRILTPAITLYLFLFAAFVRDSLDSVIHEFNGYSKLFMPTEKPITVSRQAWAKARARIPYAFLRGIFQLIVQIFCNKFCSVIHWKGFRVLAADATRIRLAKNRKLKEIFGSAENRHDNCPPQATLVCLVSVFTGVCIDFVVGVFKAAEIKLTKILLWDLGPKDLVLLDACYFNFGFLAFLLSRGLQFIARAHSNFRMNIIKQIGLGDFLCEIKVSKQMQKKFRVAETFQARVIKFHPKGFRPIILITTLKDPAIASFDEIAMLYSKRWRIELVYRELKHTLDIENIRSHSFHGVHKEIVAQLITNNLIRYTMQEAAIKYGPSDAQVSIKYSFKRAFNAMKKVIEIGICTPKFDIEQVYEKLLKQIVRHRVIERPGRSYPRLFTSRAKKHREKMKKKILQMLKESLYA